MAQKKPLILIGEDDSSIRLVITQALIRRGYETKATEYSATLMRWISSGIGDLVISDVLMPDENGLDLLPKIKKLRPELQVIIMSAQNTILTALTAAERGAFEYLAKPFDIKKLIEVVEKGLEKISHKILVNKLIPKDPLPLTGRSSAMQEIYRILARLMNNDLTVMITGESGTGKELVARALHQHGKRKSGPFIAVRPS